MTNTGTPGTEQTCPICTVKIKLLRGPDHVMYATGATATREELWQRVCQHVKDRPGCINRQGGLPSR